MSDAGTEAPPVRLLDDADWVRLLRRSVDSDFGPDGRGPLEYLIPLTAELAREDRSCDEISTDTAHRWLHELDEVVEMHGFRPGPTCVAIAERLRTIPPAPLLFVPMARRVLSADELARPLDDTEWMNLLSDNETGGNLGLLHAFTSVIEWSDGLEANQVSYLWYTVGNVLLDDPTWRPGPLLSRVLAQTRLRSGRLVTGTLSNEQVEDLRALAGIVPGDNPTAPWADYDCP